MDLALVVLSLASWLWLCVTSYMLDCWSYWRWVWPLWTRPCACLTHGVLVFGLGCGGPRGLGFPLGKPGQAKSKHLG